MTPAELELASTRQSPELDFRFGWRWLLPAGGRGRVALAGFSSVENAFWRSALQPDETGEWLPGASLEIVNADSVAPSPARLEAAARCEALALVGQGAAVRRWEARVRHLFRDVREYALLPPEAPRLVVPLGCARDAKAALALHRPGRRMARWTMRLLEGLAALGCAGPLRRKVLCIAVQDVDAPARGARPAGLASGGWSRASCALYLGTPEHDRKTVVLPLGVVDPRLIVKCAATAAAEAALQHETRALLSLRGTAVEGRVPKVWRLVTEGRSLALHQEFRVRKRLRNPWSSRDVVRFLADLSAIERCARPLAPLLAHLRERAAPQPGEARAWDDLARRASAGWAIWGHRSHGDFAPWNCVDSRPGLFVFDWERSQDWDAALSDAFHFVAAPALHVRRPANAAAIRRRALRLARRVASAGRLPIDALDPYWNLWLLRLRRDDPTYFSRLDAFS